MALLYSMVATEAIVLAEFIAVHGNTSAIARRVLERLRSSSHGTDCRLCFLMDHYIFHVFRCDSLVFLCAADSTFPRMIAFTYLEDIHKRFIKNYGKVAHNAPPYSMIDEFSSVLGQQMEFILSNPNADTLNRVAKVSETHTIVEENIGKLLDRGEQIELLEEKIKTLEDCAFHFSDAKSLEIDMEKKCVLSAKDGMGGNDTSGTRTEAGDNVPCDSPSDDDWEAIADLPPEKLLALQIPPKVADQTPQNHEVKASRRRGRGTFSYKEEELYSDRVSGGSWPAEPPEANGVEGDELKRNPHPNSSRHATDHVLVLSGFSRTTTTTDLEKLFEDFRGRGFVIRWVDDTTALAVFQTPSGALAALKSKKLPFNVKLLDEDDRLVTLIPTRDLEPPRQRPLTSAVTARRLIAHGMGIKLPSNTNSTEFRKQEEARKKRIMGRQSLKEDAWAG